MPKLKPRKCSHPGCTAVAVGCMLNSPDQWLCMRHIQERVRGTDTSSPGLSRRAVLATLLRGPPARA
jgi:hypothetical protein